MYISVKPSLQISDSAGFLQVGSTTTDRMLTCISGITRPKPKLKWYRNGIHLLDRNDTNGFSISESTTEYLLELFLVESVLTMSSDWYQNLDIFTCQASNEAIHSVVRTVILSKPGK